MAHELDFSTGEAAIMLVGKSAWHSYGTVLERPPATMAEAMELSRTGYAVELRNIALEQPRDDGTRLGIKTHRAVVRTDTGAVLGVVGSKYRPIQNGTAFAALDPLLAEGLCTIETMGALREGADVWALARFKVEDAEVREAIERVEGSSNAIETYALVTNNHSGRRLAEVRETPVRVVCANTLAMALRGESGIQVRHTASGGDKLADAAHDLFDQVIERYREIAARMVLLKEFAPMTWADFERCVLATLGPNPDELKLSDFSTPGHFEGAVERARERRQAVSTLWEHGKGHSGDRSAWEAYNGLVEALDHDHSHFRARNRLEALTDGNLARVKRDALSNLYELATAA